MRFDMFINRTFSYSVLQLASKIAAVSKFAYRDQLISSPEPKAHRLAFSL